MEMKTIERLAVYGLAGIVGLVGSNFVSQKVASTAYAAYAMIVAGIAALLVAAIALKDGKGAWHGPARLLFAVAGVVLIVRGAASVTNTQTALNTYSCGVL